MPLNRGPRRAPNELQERTRRPREWPQRSHDNPKSALRAPRSGPRRAKIASKRSFGVRDQFWNDFGASREPCWVDCGAAGVPCWSEFGRILELFGSSLRNSPGSVLDLLRPPLSRRPRTRQRHRTHTGGTRQRHRRETAEPTEEHARATGGTRHRRRRSTPEIQLSALSGGAERAREATRVCQGTL